MFVCFFVFSQVLFQIIKHETNLCLDYVNPLVHIDFSKVTKKITEPICAKLGGGVGRGSWVMGRGSWAGDKPIAFLGSSGSFAVNFYTIFL